ncbi:MAG: TmcC family electron transfer complex membrane anchor subunit [Desulfonatronovibrio sp.]
MHQLYEILTGPLAWIAWTVFIAGCLVRTAVMVFSTADQDHVVINYFNLKYALRSIAAWSIPFFPRNSRLHPWMTVVSFSFHICVILVPLFALGHVVLWEEFFGISLPALPDAVTDVMTIIVLACLLFFLVRRLSRPEVRFVSGFMDYALLLLIAAPFATGYAAYHGWFNPDFMLILHILSAEILLVSIPFTRLIHMVFAPFTRAYTASEFGAVRHSRDW